MCFWFNSKLPSGRRVWPDAPADTFQANGNWNMHAVTIIPSLKMVIVVSGASQEQFVPGKWEAAGNQRLKLVRSAVVKSTPAR